MGKEDLHHTEVVHYTVVRTGEWAVRTAVLHHMVVDTQVVRTVVDRILEAENIPADAVDRNPEMKVFRVHGGRSVDHGVRRGVGRDAGHGAVHHDDRGVGHGAGRDVALDAVVDHTLEMSDAHNLEISVDHIPERKVSRTPEMRNFEWVEMADSPPIQQVDP